MDDAVSDIHLENESSDQTPDRALIIRDEKYYMEGADCVILVENVLFKVRDEVSDWLEIGLMCYRFIDFYYRGTPPLSRTCSACPGPRVWKDLPRKTPSSLAANRPRVFAR